MRAPFLTLVKRLTGFSTPVFGVSWTPAPLDADVARHTLIFLEDRRVLFAPYAVEVPDFVAESVLEIRKHLTDALGAVDRSSPLGESLIAMRAACRKFLDSTQALNLKGALGNNTSRADEWVFLSAVGELRGVFGVHIAQLAIRYGFDLEEEILSILPGEPDD